MSVIGSVLSCGVSVVVIGLLLMFLPHGAPRYYIEAHGWTDIEGTVVGYENKNTGKCNPNYALEVRYTPVILETYNDPFGELGHMYSSQDSYSTFTCWGVIDYSKEGIVYKYSRGDKFMLKYDPNNVEKAHSADQVEEGRTWVIGIVVAMLGILIAPCCCVLIASCLCVAFEPTQVEDSAAANEVESADLEAVVR